MDSTRITGIRAVSIPVTDQDDALRFYTGLGFTVVRDVPTPNGRWIELAPGQATVVLTLDQAAPDMHRGTILMRFSSSDVDAAHAAMTTEGVDVDDILRWPRVPAMFAFRDPDGNAFSVTGDADSVAGGRSEGQ